MEPFKNRFNRKFYEKFTSFLAPLLSDFDKGKFFDLIFDEEWAGRELKQRMRHTTEVLHQFMPADFAKASKIIVQLVENLTAAGVTEESVEYMFLPDYLEIYGIEHYDEAMTAFEKVTKFTTCEFGVRPFIDRFPGKAMAQMSEWSKSENHHVRRFSSEGCRPRLPWGMALKGLKKDPAPVLEILERLKNDPSEYVRKSVANNLNDISKDHPDLALKVGNKWIGKTKNTDWVVKHAMRTLLKKGNKEAMSLFGLGSTEGLEVADFQVVTPKVKIGDALKFNFILKNKNASAKTIRLEYAIFYLLGNGKLSKKVFKISEKKYAAGAEVLVERKQSFRIITTKVFYPGMQEVSVIVNGEEFARGAFELVS